MIGFFGEKLVQEAFEASWVLQGFKSALGVLSVLGTFFAAPPATEDVCMQT